MSRGMVATAKCTIDADAGTVWNALVTPAAIKQYMFGTNVTSDWKVGGPITWAGEWKGNKYEDRGQVLAFDPNRKLSYSHYSPMMGKPDLPENYHTVTIELTGAGNQTSVTLVQDNNADEAARAESEKNWNMMLDGLKRFVERTK